MGGALVRRLCALGFPVRVRDIDPARQAEAVAAGAVAVDKSAALARESDACLVIVVDETQCEAVLTGEHGLLAGLRAGTPVLLSSTIAPEGAERLSALVAVAGGLPLDAPVSGGPARAEAGTLSVMLAAGADALAAAHPVLHAIADRHFQVSSTPGDATRAKLVNNLMAGAHLAASAEAMALAVRLGLDPVAMLALAQASSGQSWILGDRLPRALADDLAPRARTRVLAKDVALALAAAEGTGLDMPLARATVERFESACKAGWSEADDAALFLFAQGRSGKAQGPDSAAHPSAPAPRDTSP